jgi:hypothetical protein
VHEFVIGFIEHLLIITTTHYRAVAESHSLQINRAPTVFSVCYMLSCFHIKFETRLYILLTFRLETQLNSRLQLTKLHVGGHLTPTLYSSPLNYIKMILFYWKLLLGKVRTEKPVPNIPDLFNVFLTRLSDHQHHHHHHHHHHHRWHDNPL